MTSCGWGDAIITAPYATCGAYGNQRILEENFSTMMKWMVCIEERMNK